MNTNLIKALVCCFDEVVTKEEEHSLGELIARLMGYGPVIALTPTGDLEYVWKSDEDVLKESIIKWAKEKSCQHKDGGPSKIKLIVKVGEFAKSRCLDKYIGLFARKQLVESLINFN